jgi:hypothetical protein
LGDIGVEVMGMYYIKTSKQYGSLTYDMKNRTVKADGETFTSIDGLYFDGDVYVTEGRAYYDTNEVSFYFSYSVELNVQTIPLEEGGYANVLKIKMVGAPAEAEIYVIAWKPGYLIGRLLGRKVTDVTMIEYRSATRKAKLYDKETVEVKDIDRFELQSLGNTSKIQPEILVIYPPTAHKFTVTKRTTTLVIELQ